MRIEKINDKQIRCTLNKKDLSDRKIRMSELAYGTDKAKALFRDMMQQAAYEFGFEADDTPLMIEAIPMSSENLVLVITKVDDPTELDTRFSEFTPDQDDMDNPDDMDETMDEDYDNIYDDMDYDEEDEDSDSDSDTPIPFGTPVQENNFNQKAESVLESMGFPIDKTISDKNSKAPSIRLFCFSTLDDVTSLANCLDGATGNLKNSLYKDERKQLYYLFLYNTPSIKEQFVGICNFTMDFGQPCQTSYATESYFNEHFLCLIKNKALQTLANL